MRCAVLLQTYGEYPKHALYMINRETSRVSPVVVSLENCIGDWHLAQKRQHVWRKDFVDVTLCIQVSFDKDQVPVVSLTSSLRVISLTVLADSIHNILIFFAEKMWAAFARCKRYSHFFSEKFQHICVSLDENFNESLTNDIVSFEQLGPGLSLQSLKSRPRPWLRHLERLLLGLLCLSLRRLQTRFLLQIKPRLVGEHTPSPLWVLLAYMGTTEGLTSILVVLIEFWLLCRHSRLETTFMNAIPHGLNWYRPGSWTPSSIKSATSFWSSHVVVSLYNVCDVAIFTLIVTFGRPERGLSLTLVLLNKLRCHTLF